MGPRIFALMGAVCVAGLGHAALAAENATPLQPISSADWTDGRGIVDTLTPQPNTDDAPAPVVVAQSQDRLTSTGGTSENGRRPTVFDQIQIELLDIEALGALIQARLAGKPIRLSLDEAVRMALERNQDILIAEFEPMKAAADITNARGQFDPAISGSFNFQKSTTAANAQTVVFGGITSILNETANGDVGLSGQLPWGTQYSIGFDLDRQNGTFTGFMDEFGGGVQVTLTQPVLKGFGKRSNYVRVWTSQNAHGISESQVHLTVLTTIGEVIKSYWDLVGAIETSKVREESLANAQRLLDINTRRLEIGTAAAIEVLQAKAGVASRQGDFIAAQTAIADAEDILKQFIDMRDGEFFSSNRIIPVNRPSLTPFDWDEKTSLSRALAKRPEIYSAELEIENALLERKRARMDLLPQLDVTWRYRQGGRAFVRSEVLDGIRQQQDKIWSIGFNATIPIGNRTARGTHQRANLTLSQSHQRLQKVKQDAMLRVRVAGRSVFTSQILVESNQQARSLQEANVAAEESRLRLGVTTSQQVLEIQEDLTLAQTQEVQAIINFQKSHVDLQVAEGTLLENLDIIYQLPEHKSLTFFESLNPGPPIRALMDRHSE